MVADYAETVSPPTVESRRFGRPGPDNRVLPSGPAENLPRSVVGSGVAVLGRVLEINSPGRKIQLATSCQGLADHQQSNFRHVVDGVTNALSTESAVLDAAVRHVVDTPGGHVADDHAPHFQFVPGLQHLV